MDRLMTYVTYSFLVVIVEFESKDEYDNTFSPEHWNNLSDSEKCKHTVNSGKYAP